ncbi:hypothetical protein HDZ31DRAFT_64220 [Schizophyllum fasciatum]
MTYPHLTNGLTMPVQIHALTNATPFNGTRTAEELTSLLEAAAPLPDLRVLRVSFRMLKDMRLFQRIAALFPLLELLEIHAEIGVGCLWTAKQLNDLAFELRPLTKLRILRVDTFNNVLPNDYVSPRAVLPPSMDIPEYQCLLESHSIREKDIIRAFGPLGALSELWLPASVMLTLKRQKRVWRVYRLARDGDQTRLYAESVPQIE